jgi:uncharacterized metal-binding protein YceD (DUF177 family)
VTPEFSRRIAIDTLGSAVRQIAIEAGPEERTALARRFDLAGLESLTATANVTAGASGFDASGSLSAAVIQNCVITSAPVAARIVEKFSLRFVDPSAFVAVSEDMELSGSDCDVVMTDDGAIDLGEAVAQSLGLALDPFPRSEDAADGNERVWKLGVETGPFAALGALVSKAETLP